LFWARGAQSEEAPDVACTRCHVPGSDFPPRPTKPSIPPESHKKHVASNEHFAAVFYDEKSFIVERFYNYQNMRIDCTWLSVPEGQRSCTENEATGPDSICSNLYLQRNDQQTLQIPALWVIAYKSLNPALHDTIAWKVSTLLVESLGRDYPSSAKHCGELLRPFEGRRKSKRRPY
uniref:NTR domain-containing protein n=1 Tax=Heligmosomoides polygyrus TaxID=6339 RepID=A0A8L8JZT6_HELPZ